MKLDATSTVDLPYPTSSPQPVHSFISRGSSGRPGVEGPYSSGLCLLHSNLFHTSTTMYEGLSGQKRGLLFFTAVVIVFMQGGLWSAHRQAADNFPDNTLVSTTTRYLSFGWSKSRPTIKEHPIPKLMAEAETAFREKLSRQSRTLEAAVAEYQRRYGRNPPRGFDDWWKFAQENNVMMTDEYDNIQEDLAPFWDVTGEQLRYRAAIVRPRFNTRPCVLTTFDLLSIQAGHLPFVDVVRVRDGKAAAVNVLDGNENEDVSARANGFLSIVKDFQDKVSMSLRTCISVKAYRAWRAMRPSWMFESTDPQYTTRFASGLQSQ